MSKCPMCGTPATFEIRLPEGASIPCASLTEANGLLRTHQRQWPNEDLSIGVVASPNTDTPYALECRAALERIAANGIYPVNGGHACACCHTFWHADPVVTKWQTEHHYNGCAYVIAREALAKNPNELPEGATGNAGSIPARSPRFGKEKQVRLLPVDPDGSGGRDSRERPALPNAKCARCGFIRSEHDPNRAWCPVPMSMGGESYIDRYDTDHTFTDTPVTGHIPPMALPAMKAAAIEIIQKLDALAVKHDSYEYGLPMYDDGVMAELTLAVIEILHQHSSSAAEGK